MPVSYTAQQPIDDFTLRFSDAKYSATLAATTDTSLTIPGTAPSFVALIKVDADVWVALNATAAVPAGATFAVTNSELVTEPQKICRTVRKGDILHFFAPATASVSVVLYALYTNN